VEDQDLAVDEALVDAGAVVDSVITQKISGNYGKNI
jgi:hypothetical protein